MSQGPASARTTLGLKMTDGRFALSDPDVLETILMDGADV
jgi:hypothetical protein